MKWLREGRGLYSSDDGRYHITLIPAHYEVTRDADPMEGIESAVWDEQTLSGAKEAAEDLEEKLTYDVP